MSLNARSVMSSACSTPPANASTSRMIPSMTRHPRDREIAQRTPVDFNLDLRLHALCSICFRLCVYW